MSAVTWQGSNQLIISALRSPEIIRYAAGPHSSPRSVSMANRGDGDIIVISDGEDHEADQRGMFQSVSKRSLTDPLQSIAIMQRASPNGAVAAAPLRKSFAFPHDQESPRKCRGYSRTTSIRGGLSPVNGHVRVQQVTLPGAPRNDARVLHVRNGSYLHEMRRTRVRSSPFLGGNVGSNLHKNQGVVRAITYARDPTPTALALPPPPKQDQGTRPPEPGPSEARRSAPTTPYIPPRPDEDVSSLCISMIRSILPRQRKNVKHTLRKYPLRQYARPIRPAQCVIEISSSSEDEDTSTKNPASKSAKEPRDLSAKIEFFQGFGLGSRTQLNAARDTRVLKKDVVAVLRTPQNIRKYAFNPATPLNKASCIYKYALERQFIKPLPNRPKPPGCKKRSKGLAKKISRAPRSSRPATDSLGSAPGSSAHLSQASLEGAPESTAPKIAPRRQPTRVANLSMYEDMGVWTSISRPDMKTKNKAPIIFLGSSDPIKDVIIKYSPTERKCPLCTFSSLNVSSLKRHVVEEHGFSSL